MFTNRKSFSPFLAALAILVSLFVVALNVVPASAISIQTSAPVTGGDGVIEDWDELADYIFDQLQPWEDRLLLQDLFFVDTTVLSIHFMITNFDDPEIDINHFQEAFFDMLDEERIPHDRIYLDIVNEEGVRLEAHDIVLADYEFFTAEFDHGGNKEPTQATADFEFEKYYTLGDVEVYFTSADVLSDEYGDYALFTFDFYNFSNSETSAFMSIDYYLEQGGINLERVYTLDDYDTFYADVEAGDSMPDCVVGFYLEDLETPLVLVLDEFLGNDHIALAVEFVD